MDDAVIYVVDGPFLYNKREGKYAKFIDNPTSVIFVAAKRDHEFLLS